MVKAETVAAVVIVGIIGVLAYEILSKGQLSSALSTGAQNSIPTTGTSTTASGGSTVLNISEIYSPAIRYDYQSSSQTSVTTKLFSL